MFKNLRLMTDFSLITKKIKAKEIQQNIHNIDKKH